MSSLSPGVVLFEKRPRWESELKRGLSPERVLIRPCRSPGDFTALCRTMPGTVALLDFEVGPAIVLDWLQQAQLERLFISAVVILPRDCGTLEWPLRELGAVSVLTAPIASLELIRLCRSLLGNARRRASE